MLLLLLAGCTPQHLALGVTPPKAVNAGAVPTATFVGPLDVVGLDAAAVCGAGGSERTRARLLGEGRYGWRVLGLAGDRVRLPDGTVEPADGPHPALDALAARWAAADRAVATLCGEAPYTPVLFAPDAAAVHTPPTAVITTLDRAGALPNEVYLLVDDATSDAALASPPPLTGRYAIRGEVSAALFVDGDASQLASNQSAPVQEGPPEVLAGAIPAGASVYLTSLRRASWSDIVRALDALAPHGFVPGWSTHELQPASTPPRFDGHAVLYLGDTVSVLTTTSRTRVMMAISGGPPPTAAPPENEGARRAAPPSASSAAPPPADGAFEPFPGVAPAPPLTP